MLVALQEHLFPFWHKSRIFPPNKERERVFPLPGKACIFPCTVTSRSLQGQESHLSSCKGNQNSPVQKQVWFPEASTSPSFWDPVSRVSGTRMGLQAQLAKVSSCFMEANEQGGASRQGCPLAILWCPKGQREEGSAAMAWAKGRKSKRINMALTYRKPDGGNAPWFTANALLNK